MTDRRRANRFVLAERLQGSLRVLEDVYVERVEPSAITVVVAHPPVAGEKLVLDLIPSGRRRQLFHVRALRSTSLGPADGSRHRVTLVAADGRAFALPAEPESAVARQPQPGLGVLVRCLPMTLADVSSSGCRVESAHALPEGTIGVLEIEMAEGHTAEPLRICRMARIVGGVLPYAAGAEFLPLEAPTPTSVRNLMARLEMVLELGASMTAAGGGPRRTVHWSADPTGDSAAGL